MALSKKETENYTLVIKNEKTKLRSALDFTNKYMFVGLSMLSKKPGIEGEFLGNYYLIDNELINCSEEGFNKNYSYTPAYIPQRYNKEITLKWASFGVVSVYHVEYRDIVNILINKSKEGAKSTQKEGKSLSVVTPTQSTLTTLINLYKKYIDFRDEPQFLLFPVWVIGTYLHQLFDSYPYISLFGRKGTGKSKVLTLSNQLAFNGNVSVGASIASIFLMSESLQASLFFDENNIFKVNRKGGYNQRTEELMPLILTGYKKGAKVPRVEYANGKRKLLYFDAYCPKMFASTNWNDEIFGSRTIPVIMRPALKKIGDTTLSSNKSFWADVRTEILSWCFLNWKKVKDSYDSLDNFTRLRNRDWELSKPLIAVLKVLDESRVDELVSYMEEVFSVRIIDETDNYDFMVLKTVSDLPEMEYFGFSEIIAICNIGDKKPEWLNARWFGNMLKRCGVTFKKRRVGRGMEYAFTGVIDLLSRFGIVNLPSLVMAKGAEHDGSCSECKKEKVWLTHAYNFGTVDERFVCEECAKKEVVQ